MITNYDTVQSPQGAATTKTSPMVVGHELAHSPFLHTPLCLLLFQQQIIVFYFFHSSKAFIFLVVFIITLSSLFVNRLFYISTVVLHLPSTLHTLGTLSYCTLVAASSLNLLVFGNTAPWFSLKLQVKYCTECLGLIAFSIQ